MFRLAKQLGRLNLFETKQYLASGVVNKGCRSYYKDIGIQNQVTTASSKPSVTKSLTSNQNVVQVGSKLLNGVANPSWMIPRRMMSTLEQMHKKGPPKKTRFNKQKTTLEGCPQKKGIVLKVIIKKPKKPNSANRKCVRVKLSNDKHIIGYIPGEGHNLQEHNIVLIEGGRKQDLPGVKHTVVRGKYDCNHVVKKTA